MRIAMWAGVAAAITVTSADAADPKRNVILMIADDHGRDLGCYGNGDVQTPNLDRLAKMGTRFDYAFCTTASCSASRSVVLSGLHNHFNGQFGHQHSYHHFSSFPSVKSLPVLLSTAGYRTVQIGKYHVGPESVYRFDQYLSGVSPRNPVAMAERCRETISAKSDKPFFIYMAFTDPHRDGNVLNDVPGKPNSFGNARDYPGIKEVRYDSAKLKVPRFLPDTPGCRAELAQYYQSVSRVDQGVGRVIDILKETGHEDDTMVLYLSDNGMAFPGSKTTLYDPGMHLPLIVRSPTAKKKGVVTDAMVSWVDLTPTILDFAGVTDIPGPPAHAAPGEGLPAANPKKAGKTPAPYAFHGRSFLAVLDQEKTTGWDAVFASHTFHEITMYYPMRVIRTRQHKLLLNLAHQLPFPFASDLKESSTWKSIGQSADALYGQRRVRDFIHRPRYELYDLSTDPNEVKNLSKGDGDPTKVEADLRSRLRQFQEKSGDPWVVKYHYE